MRSANRAITMLTVVAASVALAAPAMAAPEIDQQTSPASPGSAGDLDDDLTMASSFTAGRTGALTRVDLNFSRADLPRGVVNPQPDLTIGIYSMSGGLPGGSALASERPSLATLTALTTVIGGVGDSLSVFFSSPAQVTDGHSYFIVASVDSGNVGYGAYRWYAYAYDPAAPTDSNRSFNLFSWDPGVWHPWTGHVGTFTTYVDSSWAGRGGAGGGAGAGAAPGGSNAVDETQWQLLFTSNGTNVGALVSPGGAYWMELPRLVSTERAGERFLGWSTSPDFPVDVAAEQVADGEGAIDDVFNGQRMIFIPVGGSTFISGNNHLFAIWG